MQSVRSWFELVRVGVSWFELATDKPPEKIGNISKSNGIKCMQACNVQENNNQMSIAAYPQRNTFFYQKMFCDLASHILQKTCQFESRAYFLKRKQPFLCAILKDFDIFFGQHALETETVSFSFSIMSIFFQI